MISDQGPKGPSDTPQRPEGTVVPMFSWREQRADAARRAAEVRARRTGDPADALTANSTLSEWAKAARLRQEAETRVRERRAQEMADTLKSGSYLDPRPKGRGT
jgi:hypothetical protein